MRRLSAADLDRAMTHFPRAGKGSLLVMSSQIGLSSTELRLWLDSNEHQWFADFDSGWMMELVEVDTTRATLRFHLHGCGKHDAVRHMLLDWFIQTRASKAYCYLFPSETQERQCLQSLGFEQEAVFRRHVHAHGAYQDLLVYGLIKEGR
jgi:hypothetical protein